MDKEKSSTELYNYKAKPSRIDFNNVFSELTLNTVYCLEYIMEKCRLYVADTKEIEQDAGPFKFLSVISNYGLYTDEEFEEYHSDEHITIKYPIDPSHIVTSVSVFESMKKDFDYIPGKLCGLYYYESDEFIIRSNVNTNNVIKFDNKDNMAYLTIDFRFNDYSEITDCFDLTKCIEMVYNIVNSIENNLNR
jgi:hypothetical protein